MPALIHKVIENKWKQRMWMICLSFSFVACTQTNPAHIRDIANTAIKAQNPLVTIHKNTGRSYQSRPLSIQVSKAMTVQSSYAKSTGSMPTPHKRTITTTSVEQMSYSRDYDSIPKGGYKGDFYTVKRGDTLFYIAWITGNDYRALAAQNRISEPYDLSVGRVLNVKGDASVLVTKKNTNTMIGSSSSEKRGQRLGNIPPSQSTMAAEQTRASTSPMTPNMIHWSWPAQGKIIEPYTMKSKGIDLGGQQGDKVMAAAAGQVVYAGNALPGYGNLIIIKHNDDYLTAYAHNHAILVKEQQRVNAGDQIALMGSTGTSSTRLHFEIRYKAKSVDPIQYLPKR